SRMRLAKGQHSDRSERFFNIEPWALNRCCRLGPSLNRPFDFPFSHLALESLPLVVEFFAARQTELDFDPTAFEIEFQRNQRKPALLGLSGKPLDLAAMEQQLARARRLMVEAVGPGIGADMRVD